ncbi:MAG: hypothetical protein WD847_21395 [Pirellulales bacterium]
MTGTVPNWLERWLGVPEAGSGEGTAWALDHGWDFAPWATLLVGAAAVAWIIACYLREIGTAGKGYRAALTGIRLALVGIVLFMVAGFVVSLHRTGLPYVVVIVDDSASMGIADRYDDEKLRALIDERLKEAALTDGTRLNLAKSVLLARRGAFLRAIDQRYKLKVYYLSADARAQSGSAEELIESLRALDATGASSRLGQGVAAVLDDLRGTPPTAIVLLSDGITTDGPTLAEAALDARRKQVPLFTVALGSETPTRDLELGDLLVDEVVFVEDVVNFEFKLTAHGLEGRQVRVVLRRQEGGAPLAELLVRTGPDGEPQRLRLPYRPMEVGDFDYVIEVETLPEELRADNNRQLRRLSVRKERIRVLLLQSYPNYEFRYLKTMLERDSTIQLSSVLQEADLEYAELDESALRVFPARREELFEYDVVIFGDVNPAFLSASAIDNLRAFVVEKGGGMIVVAGPLYTPIEYRDSPLAGLLPIDFNNAAGPDPGALINDPYQPQPTDLGLASPNMQLADDPRDNPSVWQNLSPLYWYFEAPSLKPAARVLAVHPLRMSAEGKPLPIFVMHYVGAGKVLFHATEETSRWRIGQGEVYFARYWVQSIRYLSRSKLLGKDRSAELTADRREYRRGESARLRVRFFDERQAPVADDGVTVVVQREGDTTRRLDLRRVAGNRGVFEGALPRLADGRYHAWIAAPNLPGDAPWADFQVVAPPGEMARVELDVGELKRASLETKGRYYTLATASNLLGDLPEGRPVKIDALPPVVLWNKWPLLLLFLSLIIAEWLLRKRKGML